MTTSAPRSGPVHPRWLAALVGVLSTLSGAGVAHLTAAILAPAASPVVAVGSVVIDRTPTPVKEWAIATFGSADKPILLGSVTVVTLLLAAGCGLLARRRPGAGAVGLVALTALAGAAAVTRPGASGSAALPALSAAAVGVSVLVLLDTLARRWAGSGSPQAEGVARGEGSEQSGPTTLGPQARPTSAGVARRAFLGAAAGAAVLGTAAAIMGQRIVVAGRAMVRALPGVSAPLPPLPAGLETTVPGVTPLVTPTADFYRVDTALVLPRVDVDAWRLRIDGDVETPLELTYADLLDMDLVERDITMTCVSNEVGGGYVGAARWTGVLTADLLRRAGVRSGADQILSTSVDGYTASTPVAALLDDWDALVAVGMNGLSLDAVHGFPARLVTPGLYGYVGATKWLTTLTATTFDARKAYWTRRGWADRAPIKPMARIDTPLALRTIPRGRTAIGGVAWAQRRGIDRVEVQIDEEPWQTARLGPDVTIDYWRQWWLPWDPEPGQHTLRARVVDGSGQVQTADRAKPFPDGASGIHEVVVTVA